MKMAALTTQPFLLFFQKLEDDYFFTGHNGSTVLP